MPIRHVLGSDRDSVDQNQLQSGQCDSVGTLKTGHNHAFTYDSDNHSGAVPIKHTAREELLQYCLYTSQECAGSKVIRKGRRPTS